MKAGSERVGVMGTGAGHLAVSGKIGDAAASKVAGTFLKAETDVGSADQVGAVRYCQCC